MRRSSIAVGVLAALSPILVLAALVLTNVTDMQAAWKASSPYPVTDRPIALARSFRAALAGRSEARRDIRDGQLGLKAWGLPMPAVRVYRDILAKRYAIDYHGVAGCVVDATEEAGWITYNEVMETEIARRFGPDLLERTWRESEQTYAAQRRAK